VLLQSDKSTTAKHFALSLSPAGGAETPRYIPPKIPAGFYWVNAPLKLIKGPLIKPALNSSPVFVSCATNNKKSIVIFFIDD